MLSCEAGYSAASGENARLTEKTATIIEKMARNTLGELGLDLEKNKNFVLNH